MAGTDCQGHRPQVQAARERALEQRKQVNTFAAVAENFIERHVKGPAYVKLERIAVNLRKLEPAMSAEAAFDKVWGDPKNKALVEQTRREGLRKGETERIIRREFIKRWGARPATDILTEEVAAVIRIVAKRAPGQAFNVLGDLRRLYSWAIGTHEFGISTSPVAGLRPADLIGKRVPRERILTDEELRAVWYATTGGLLTCHRPVAHVRHDRFRRLPLASRGPFVRMLILTGQRLSEVAGMAWDEIDFDKSLWTISAARMKAGRSHAVPLMRDALALLEGLPRFSGHFVFTTTNGEKAINGFGATKATLDRVSNVSGWTFHDLRRTMRTHLSALPVQDLVRELVIAHSRPGLHRVYDQHSYLDEKRQCLTLWETRLRGILNPAPGDITDLIEARRKRAEVG